MRFARMPKTEGYTDTSRKRAALRRNQQRQRDTLPLFAEMIAAEQPHEDLVMAERAARWARLEQERRDRRAAKWREARRRLAGLGHNLHPRVLHYWNTHRWLPGEPTYLLGVIHSIEVGNLTPTEDGGFTYGTLRNAVPVEEVRARLSIKAGGLLVSS